MGNDGAAEMVGAISYYVILSLFPMLLGIIALLGFFLPSAAIQDAIYGFIQRNLPGLEQTLQINIAGIIVVRGPLGIISIIGFFWSGGAMFSAISRAINRAWGISRLRHLAFRKFSEVAMSISATAFLVVSMIGTAVLSFFNPGSDLIQRIVNSLISFVLIFIVFLLIYKTVPNTKTFWWLVWPGAALAAIFFEVARIIMGLYFTTFTNFELIYGSIGSIVVLLIWVYFSAFVMVAGAEVSFEYSRTHLRLPPKKWTIDGFCP
jgi:membrane protein